MRIATAALVCMAMIAQGKEKQKPKAPPTTLEETFAHLDNIFDDTAAYGFMMMPEKIAAAQMHMGLGMNLRNGWGLWRNSELAQHFAAKGVADPEEMSDIIFTSYHRHLNKEPTDLDGQVKERAQHRRNMDSVFTAETFGSGMATDSLLAPMFAPGDTVLVSVYASYKKRGNSYASSARGTAVVREKRGQKLMIELISLHSEPRAKSARKVGDLYEERPYYCRPLPPPGWHR